MTVKIDNASARVACDAINDQFDLGAGAAGHLRLYNGARPASVATAIGAQVMLVEFVLPAPLFANSVAVTGGAQATANAVADATAAATGTATWGRVFDKDNTARADLDVSVTAGTGDAKLANVDIVAGVEVKIVSWTATHPE
jgi:hypothetical protein